MAKTTTNEPLTEDFDLTAIMRQTTGDVGATSAPPPASDKYTWKRFTFICNKALAEKLHGIARHEGYPVSAVMQLMLRRGIEAYEQKHGSVRHSGRTLDDLL